ncbi:NAD(P)/FAD-dependent oxidoreductase [Oceanicoccus sagamiensis]|uniref:FAD-dependent oxidoreductase n=1 Tax=Oceanicoccus sagamiensis TaxID=716816 RepID=A0A1X9NA99_9GAMM|nr:FAD-binding oxidoreductase [Oceanicoccus sagamiensis]ARN72865.1 FAD-dependent oxidoreductase [Oceanicoccus sagamiensis]
MLGLKASVETQSHTTSYYAATANWQTDYPLLEGDIQADVAVIGGGFSGVNTALELAEKGYKVALIEANKISWGATGRNGGQVIGGIGHDAEQFEKFIGKEGVRAIYDMGIECTRIIKDRVEKYQIDCDLKWGYLDVALKPRHMTMFEEWRQYEADMGNPTDIKLLDANEVKHYVNSDAYCGGLYNPTDNGHVHPLNLCIGEAKAAEHLGVQIFEHSRVNKITHGEKPVVYTDKGSVTANFVVTCGNAYMENLVPKLASRVLPSCSSVIATAPLSDELAKSIMPSDSAVCDPRTALDYFRLSADKRLLFGGLSNYTGLEPSNLEATMRKKMAIVFPQLANIDIDYGWSGQMGIGLNRMPQLGRLSKNVFYIQAYSGHGVAPTHMMGRITAEMISGTAERFDVFAKIRHWPFPGGKLLRRPGLAVGMLYFKLMDML